VDEGQSIYGYHWVLVYEDYNESKSGGTNCIFHTMIFDLICVCTRSITRQSQSRAYSLHQYAGRLMNQ